MAEVLKGASLRTIPWARLGLEPQDYLRKLGGWAEADWLVKAAEEAKEAVAEATAKAKLGGRSLGQEESKVLVEQIRSARKISAILESAAVKATAAEKSRRPSSAGAGSR